MKGNPRHSCCIKDIEKNKNVSTVEPIIDEVSGAINHSFFLSYQKFEHLIIEQLKKQT